MPVIAVMGMLCEENLLERAALGALNTGLEEVWLAIQTDGGPFEVWYRIGECGTVVSGVEVTGPLNIIS